MESPQSDKDRILAASPYLSAFLSRSNDPSSAMRQLDRDEEFNDIFKARFGPRWQHEIAVSQFAIADNLEVFNRRSATAARYGLLRSFLFIGYELTDRTSIAVFFDQVLSKAGEMGLLNLNASDQSNNEQVAEFVHGMMTLGAYLHVTSDACQSSSGDQFANFINELAVVDEV